ncbi:MAG: hypothetical protein H8F28_13920, partial [Fibrella sp.]|nr:hypothetical protein [Armatimonadota bacterium]
MAEQYVYMSGSVTSTGSNFIPKETATVPLFDHGYLYGDGVFEGVRV